MNKRLKQLLYLLYFIVTVLGLLEISVRVWGYAEHYIYDPIYKPFPQSEAIAYVHKPGLENVRARGLSIINTDSLGLRSLYPGTQYGPKQPHEYRIAIMGDSVTFGEGIQNTEDTYAYLVEAALNQQQDEVTVQVFNFAVSAYSVQSMAATLSHRALAITPDLVIMAVAAPDFNLSRTGQVDEQGYIVSGQSLVLSGRPRLKQVLRQVRLVYLIRDLLVQYRANRLPPTNSIQDHLPPAYQYLVQFSTTAQQNQIPYLLLLLPNGSPEAMESVREQLIQDGIHFLDLTAVGHTLPPEKFQVSQFDAHPSALVHQQISQALVAYLMAQDHPASHR